MASGKYVLTLNFIMIKYLCTYSCFFMVKVIYGLPLSGINHITFHSFSHITQKDSSQSSSSLLANPQNPTHSKLHFHHRLPHFSTDPPPLPRFDFPLSNLIRDSAVNDLFSLLYFFFLRFFALIYCFFT